MPRRSTLAGLKTGLNIIPIINVAFIIILILMLIAPFLEESRIQVSLPEAFSSKVQNENKITLTISKAGVWELEDRQIDKSQLSAFLRARLSVDLVRVLVIKADKNIPYQWVREAIETAKSSGVLKIVIATKPKDTGK